MPLMFRNVASITFAAMLIAGAALAQEYGRGSGGELDLITKRPTQFSGSLGLSHSTLFGNSLKGYEATLGGAVIPDRMWFFASVQRNDALHFDSLSAPRIAPSTASSGKISVNLGDRQTLNAFVAHTPLTVATPALTTVPASFYSLHYTGIISPNAFFTANVSQSVAH